MGTAYQDEQLAYDVNQAVAVTWDPKIAALLFDKVAPFVYDNEEIPNDIMVDLGVDNTTMRLARIHATCVMFGKSFAEFVNEAMLEMSNNITNKWNIAAIPLFSVNTRQRTYKEGQTESVFAAIHNLEIVKEDDLTWEQVIELRKDKDSRIKYTRLLHWLDEKMVGKSQSFIEDAIALKIADYKEALKKHGMKTVIGSISKILNPQSMQYKALSMVAGGLVTHDLSQSLITPACLSIAEASIYVTKELLKKQDIERGANYPEAAFFYEVEKLKEK